MHLSRNPDLEEENIPLNSTSNQYHDEHAGKGKARAVDGEAGTPIFDVGEDEEEYISDHSGRKHD